MKEEKMKCCENHISWQQNSMLCFSIHILGNQGFISVTDIK